MTTATKLLRAMRNNPRDWVIEQLLTVTQRHGVEVRNHGGSHMFSRTRPSLMPYRSPRIVRSSRSTSDAALLAEPRGVPHASVLTVPS